MRDWNFVVLLCFIGLLAALMGCGRISDTIPETAVFTPLPTISPLTAISPMPPPASEDLVISEPTSAPTVAPILVSTPAKEPTASPNVTAVANKDGALVGISMTSQVGVLLDEIPQDMRDQVVADLLAQPQEAWLERARRQVQLTRNRLNFRNFVYEEKGQLPLPPAELWDIRLDDEAPTRQLVQGHDLVMIGYTFTSTLLTDGQSPGQAEPALVAVGGVWQEPFIFPIDPDLLLQRTGNACINEGGFPPNSFDSENIWHFYDFDCTADSGGAAGCHRAYLPTLSCRGALAGRVGEVETSLRFERLAWDDGLAEQVRLEAAREESADLTAVTEDLATNRIVYRYFEEDDCALAEGAVGGSGWRRLLQFDATVWNIGEQPLHIGKANVEDAENHVFTYSACHDHFHYTNYGDFFLQGMAALTGSKQAFCVQSTTRMSNNETTPLTHDYSCSFQGIQAGWADEYIAGLDAQWVDITDLKLPAAGTAVQLGFKSNGDQFLCEGKPIVDENGVQLWEPSGFVALDGDSINRPQCDFIPDWDVNNTAVQEVFIPPDGSLVTTPCTNSETSPLRNCGFFEVEMNEEDLFCEPGTAVEITLPDSYTEPLVIRACEWSNVLNTGVACSYETSLFNEIILDPTEAISFSCPLIRDSNDLEGKFSLYAFSLLEN